MFETILGLWRTMTTFWTSETPSTPGLGECTSTVVEPDVKKPLRKTKVPNGRPPLAKRRKVLFFGAIKTHEI